MWIFSNKASTGVLSAAGISSDDVLSNYTIEQNSLKDCPRGDDGLACTHQSGICKKTGDRVSIFTYHPRSEKDNQRLSATVKRMKTLRHPNILAWAAGTKLDEGAGAVVLRSGFHVVTESVMSLSDYIKRQADAGGCDFNLVASWGIFQITRVLAFLNDDCQLSHNDVSAAAVYVTRSGEWKLANLQFVSSLSNTAEQNNLRNELANLRPSAYTCPAGQCVDAWGLACLIWEVFNTERLTNPTQLSSKAGLDHLPKSLQAPYRRLLSSRVPLRRTSSLFSGFLKSGYFTTDNNYIATLLFLEEIQLKEAGEKTEFLASLGQRAAGLFPEDICRYKILPHLVQSLQFGSGVEALVPVLELTPLLSKADFDSVVLPGLLKLFASPDRATRVRLLDQLPRFVDKLPLATVEAQVFTPVVAGFADANPLVREATIRAMVHLAPSLHGKTLNDTLIRHLTNLQFKDEQGGIRANATVCLAKIACRLEPKIRRGPLLNAFLRATRDPFPPSRQASATSLAATQVFFSTQDLAGKVIPCLSFLAVDKEKEIREIALKALRGMLDRLDKASEDASSEEANDEVVGAVQPGKGAQLLKSSAAAAAAASGLGSWAFSALSSISTHLITSPSTANVTPAANVTGQKHATLEHSAVQHVAAIAATPVATNPKSRPMQLENDSAKSCNAKSDEDNESQWGDCWEEEETTSKLSSASIIDKKDGDGSTDRLKEENFQEKNPPTQTGSTDSWNNFKVSNIYDSSDLKKPIRIPQSDEENKPTTGTDLRSDLSGSVKRTQETGIGWQKNKSHSPPSFSDDWANQVSRKPVDNWDSEANFFNEFLPPKQQTKPSRNNQSNNTRQPVKVAPKKQLQPVKKQSPLPVSEDWGSW